MSYRHTGRGLYRKKVWSLNRTKVLPSTDSVENPARLKIMRGLVGLV
jgi:hypothetical protein